MIKDSPEISPDNHAGASKSARRQPARGQVDNHPHGVNDLTSAVLDSVGSLVIVLDKDGRIVRFNHACEELSGYAAEEVIGRQYWTLFGGPGDDTSPPQEFLESFNGQFMDSYADYAALKDGSRRFISWKNTTLRGKSGEIEFIICAGIDLTEQRHAEQALRESEERFRALSNSSPVGIFQTDIHGHCLYTNARWQKIAGMTLEESLGDGWLRAVHPDDRDAVTQAWQEAVNEQQEFTLEFRYRTPGNVEGWVHSRAAALYSVTGEATGFVGTAEDITEQKQAEEVLEAQAAALREQADLLDLTHDAILVRDLGNNHITFWNVGAQEMYGWTADQALGVSSHSLLQTRFPELLEAITGKLLREGHWEGRLIHTRKDNTQLTVASRWVLQRDESGNALSTLEINTDVTERQKAEHDRQFLAQAGEVLASSLDYTDTLDSVAKLAVGRLADYCIVDLVGENGDVQRVVTAHIDPAKEGIARSAIKFALKSNAAHPIIKALSSGEASLIPAITPEFMESFEISEDLRDSIEDLGPKSLMIVPLASRDKILGAITLVSSTSGRQYTPEDLALAKELARRAAIAVENARLYSQAQEAVASREELLSIVSHDLKNYLMVLRGFAYLLPEYVRQDGSTETAQLMDGLGQIDTTAAQMDMLVQDLLDFARLQVGRPLDLYRQPVELVSLARRVVQQQQRTTWQHAIALQAQVSELHGFWDKDRIERALANLLSNAIKYSPRGTRITVSLCEERLAGNPMGLLAVQDEGIGIPAEDLPYVFDRFHRSRNARKISGTGIGLSSTRQIVEQHGGTIGVESQEGVGSTFTLRLPMDLPAETWG